MKIVMTDPFKAMDDYLLKNPIRPDIFELDANESRIFMNEITRPGVAYDPQEGCYFYKLVKVKLNTTELLFD
jgi:hypothetical protein